MRKKDLFLLLSFSNIGIILLHFANALGKGAVYVGLQIDFLESAKNNGIVVPLFITYALFIYSFVSLLLSDKK